MNSKANGPKRGFVFRYRKYLIAIVLAYIILTLVLIFLSRSDQVPFQYQVF
jgi:hypothetical protein